MTTATYIGPYTVELLKEYAEQRDLTLAQSLKTLMLYVESLIESGLTSWLGTDWQRIHERQKLKTRGLPPAIAKVDLTKLHRSDRTKSGYVGVYANGSGFRATGRQGEYLGTFKSAEEAALLRRKHYIVNGLPYGEMETSIDEMRRFGEQGDDEHLREIVLETARLTGTLHLYDLDQGGTAGRHLKMAGFDDDADFDSARAKVKQHDEASEKK